MADVPILNPVLSVEAVDFQHWKGHWLGVVITPWCMSMLLVPGSLGFRSITALLAKDVVGGMETAFRMALVATSLVAGLLLANLVLRPRRLV